MGVTIEADKPTKAWYQSKTLWLNTVALLLAVGDYLLGTGLLTAQSAAVVVSVVGVLNVALRTLGGAPLVSSAKPEPPAAPKP